MLPFTNYASYDINCHSLYNTMDSLLLIYILHTGIGRNYISANTATVCTFITNHRSQASYFSLLQHHGRRSEGYIIALGLSKVGNKAFRKLVVPRGYSHLPHKPASTWGSRSLECWQGARGTTRARKVREERRVATGESQARSRGQRASYSRRSRDVANVSWDTRGNLKPPCGRMRDSYYIKCVWFDHGTHVGSALFYF